MAVYSPAQPYVLIANGDTKVITNYYSWATFINDGDADGTIDFGAGNVATLKAGVSLTMPYVGRPYGRTEIDGSATVIQIIYTR